MVRRRRRLEENCLCEGKQRCNKSVLNHNLTRRQKQETLKKYGHTSDGSIHGLFSVADPLLVLIEVIRHGKNDDDVGNCCRPQPDGKESLDFWKSREGADFQ